MIYKTISLVTIITIVTIVGTFIFTQGATSAKIDNKESGSEENRKKIMSNTDKVQKVEIDVAKIEAKIDEGFKRLETLLIEN